MRGCLQHVLEDSRGNVLQCGVWILHEGVFVSVLGLPLLLWRLEVFKMLGDCFRVFAFAFVSSSMDKDLG